MSFSNEELKALAIEMVAILPPESQPMELVLATGELLTQDAMNLARLYDSATNRQRAALDAVATIIRGE